ncbi:MAG: AMP-binding protein [Vallitaleaceae bacterium]|nr:AMP-binding protein [Vallitaleaceae bacterium]
MFYKEYLKKEPNFSSYEDYYQNFDVIEPEKFNFAYDIVDRIAKEDPQRTALVWADFMGQDRIFSFKEMSERSSKTAHYFKSLGIGKGDAVLLVLKNHYEFWFSFLALHKLGAIAVPATHMLMKKDFVYRNNSASIKMIVAVNSEELLNSVDSAQSESPTLKQKVVIKGSKEGWHEFYAGIESFPAVFERPIGAEDTCKDDIMLLYFTSGTTGYPKMVQHNFAYPLGHINTALYWHQVTDRGLHYTVADTGWAKAVWGKIYGQWLCGSAVFVLEYDKFVATELLEAIQKYRITTFCAPPTIYRFIIKEDMTHYDLSSLKSCSVAGEPLSPEVYNQFLKLTGISLQEGYGQTELTVTLGTFPWMAAKPGSMGRPAPGYDIDLVDEWGNTVKLGEEGQVVVRLNKRRPIGMFGCYYRDEAATTKVWHDDIYYTGDMAWCDEDGYFWFVGRSDDVIKSSGYRIGPFEVESALLEHPAVLECAVTGVPDEVRGQIIKATITLVKGYTASDTLAKEIQEHVKKVTAPYKYPRIIEFVEALPKTISGKIRRVQIREESK